MRRREIAASFWTGWTASLTGWPRGGRPSIGAMRALAAAWPGTIPPVDPFRSLVRANRQDQEVLRYETFEELLGYCRLSAAPVGELVLHVFGAATPERLALSERVCAGLQVVEHIQDVAEDYQRGRVYMPRADMERFGLAEEDLDGPVNDARSGRCLPSSQSGLASCWVPDRRWPDP